MTLIEFLSARLDEDASRHECDAAAVSGRLGCVPCHRLGDEVRTKRGIVDLITYPSGGIRAPFGPEQEAVLRYLAEVYADHPDYREEWRP